MSVAWAFLRRDYLIWSSYRMSAFWQVAGVFMTLGLVYFAGTAIGDRSEIITEEDGSYIAFVLLGVAFMDILLQGLSSLPRAIGDNQRAGTFEPMLLAPITAGSMIVDFWLFKFLFSTFRMIIMITFGVVVLGFWGNANLLTVLAVLIPALLTFMAMGALSASFIILVKQGDPILVAYAAVTAILGGAIFPVDSLPDWIQPITQLLPLTHALSGIRAGFNGASVNEVVPQIAILTAMAAMTMPPGIFAFDWALNRARQEGSLGEY
ncbi:MAG: ABC transporter permease [Dehalococcoidia bacterium]